MAEHVDALSPAGVSELATFVIRPPRAEYSQADLGDKTFSVDGSPVHRDDLTINNSRGLRLHASHFRPHHHALPGSTPPAVVYLHGNGSCRVEATVLLSVTIPFGLSLFAFDFSGSGQSDGEYISLGVWERLDVDAVVDHLVRSGVNRIILWGHSMGAATALMYAGLCDRSSAVKALILDSPFASFEKLAQSLVSEMPLPLALPRKLVLTVGVRAVRKIVRERAGFDVHDIDPLQAARSIPASLPAFFLHGTSDVVVPLSHGKLLHDQYPCKDKVWLPLDDYQHDTPRPDSAMDKAFFFMMRILCDVRSITFLEMLKMRGNVAVFNKRFNDACFLYGRALDALAASAPRREGPTARRSGVPAIATAKAAAAAAAEVPMRARAQRAAAAAVAAKQQRAQDASAVKRNSSTPSIVSSVKRWRSRAVALALSSSATTDEEGAESGGQRQYPHHHRNQRQQQANSMPHARGRPLASAARARRTRRASTDMARRASTDATWRASTDGRAHARAAQGFHEMAGAAAALPSPRIVEQRRVDDIGASVRRGTTSAGGVSSCVGSESSGANVAGVRIDPAPDRCSEGSIHSAHLQWPKLWRPRGVVERLRRCMRGQESCEDRETATDVSAGGMGGMVDREPPSIDGSTLGSVGNHDVDEEKDRATDSVGEWSGRGVESRRTSRTSRSSSRVRLRSRGRRDKTRHSKDVWAFRNSSDGRSHERGFVSERVSAVWDRPQGRVGARNAASVEANAALAGDCGEEVGEWELDEGRRSLALALFGNRSLARRKTGDLLGALQDANCCLQLDASWVRGYLRKAAALREGERLREAKAVVEAGLKREPHHAGLIDMQRSIEGVLNDGVGGTARVERKKTMVCEMNGLREGGGK